MKKLILLMVMLASFGCMITACSTIEEKSVVNPIEEPIPDIDTSNKEEPIPDTDTSNKEEPIPDTDTSNEEEPNSDFQAEEADKEGEGGNEADNKALDIFGDEYGAVDSLTEDGFVINRTSVIDVNTMAINLEDKDLVTVHCTDATVYEIITIKNNGVNGPSDASMKAATAADVKSGSNVTLSGSYEGEMYNATRVGIVISV